MIVVDTPVFVATMRQPLGPPASMLRGLLDADLVVLALPVRMELMAGVAARDRARLRRALAGLPLVVPTEDTWRMVEAWIEPAAAAGHRFAVSDLLIGGLAEEIGAHVWSLDSDFERMESLGLVHLYG